MTIMVPILVKAQMPINQVKITYDSLTNLSLEQIRELNLNDVTT